MMNDKTLEQTILFTQMVAHKQGWLLNPDKDFYDTLVEGLMKIITDTDTFSAPVATPRVDTN